MDELKLLIEMVAHLPAMALWVLVGFFAYKVVVVGSIYGVIRFVTARLFDWLQAKKVEIEHKEIRPMLDGMCVRAQTDRLIAQICRLKGKGVRIETDYIHNESVEWLRSAIDMKIASEAAPNSADSQK